MSPGGSGGVNKDARCTPSSLIMENDPEEEEEYRQTVLPAGVCEGVTESAVERMGKCARMDDDDDANATCVQTTASHGEIPRKKKTRGRVKIEMEFIQNKLRRYTTFSKRKSGIMKKAYELSTLTGTQVLLLVASETGHVYTFATPKLQPMITSESGKALIQTCLNSPDVVANHADTEQRMSSTGFEEPELSYTVQDEDGREQTAQSLSDQGLTPSISQSTPVNQILLTETGYPSLSSSTTEKDSHRSKAATEALPIVSANLPLTIQPGLAIPGFNLIPGTGTGTGKGSGVSASTIVPQYPGMPTALGFPSVINSTLLAQLQSNAQAMQVMLHHHQQQEQRQQQESDGPHGLVNQNPMEGGERVSSQKAQTSHDNSEETPESQSSPPPLTMSSISSASIHPTSSRPAMQPSSSNLVPAPQLLHAPVTLENPVVSSGTSQHPTVATSLSTTCMLPQEHPPPLTFELAPQLGLLPQYPLLHQHITTGNNSSDSPIGSIIFSPAGVAGGGIALGRMSRAYSNETPNAPNAAQSITQPRNGSF